jgi:hypothetical protein
LFPGAAVASMVTVFFEAGGARMNAEKHEALSCSMIFPSLYRGSSVNCVSGGKSKRSGICSSLANPFLRQENTEHSNNVQKDPGLRVVEWSRKDMPAGLKRANGVLGIPAGGIDADVPWNFC